MDIVRALLDLRVLVYYKLPRALQQRVHVAVLRDVPYEERDGHLASVPSATKPNEAHTHLEICAGDIQRPRHHIQPANIRHDLYPRPELRPRENR